MRNMMVARLGWLLPGITIFLSSFLHLVLGDARNFPFFISEADYPGIQRWIFTIGFFISGIILMYFSWVIFSINKEKSRWYWIYISLFSGIWVGANLSVLAFMDMYDHIEIHVASALNIFYFGVAWGVVTHIALVDGSAKGKRMRYFSLVFAVLSLVGMIHSMNLAFEAHPEFVENNDLNLIQDWVDWAAPFEYALAISFLVTLYSFEAEIDGDEEE